MPEKDIFTPGMVIRGFENEYSLEDLVLNGLVPDLQRQVSGECLKPPSLLYRGAKFPGPFWEAKKEKSIAGRPINIRVILLPPNTSYIDNSSNTVDQEAVRTFATISDICLKTPPGLRVLGVFGLELSVYVRRSVSRKNNPIPRIMMRFDRLGVSRVDELSRQMDDTPPDLIFDWIELRRRINFT